MSIADRITSMSNNLSSAYDGIEYLGVDTTGIDKNLQNLSSMLNVVYEGLPKVSDEGISPTLEGSRVGKLNTSLKGSDTQQESTTGANKLPNVTTQTLNGITITNNKDGSYTLNGTASTNTYFDFFAGTFDSTAFNGYYLKEYNWENIKSLFGLSTSAPLAYRISSSNRQSIQSLGASATNGYIQLADNGSNLYLAVRIQGGGTLNNVIIKPMITLSLDTNFEPYTGGIPSPNPDFPQSIHVVKGNNTVFVGGKNWLPPFVTEAKNGTTVSQSGTTVTINGVSTAAASISKTYFTLPAGTYRFITKYKSGTIDNAVQLFINATSDDSRVAGIIFRSTDYTDNKSVGITLTEQTDMYLVAYIGGSGRTYDNFKFDIQVIKGSTADYDFAEYQPVGIFPINLPVQNLFDKDNANIYNGYISSVTPHVLVSSVNSKTLYISVQPNTAYTISKTSSTYFRTGFTSGLPSTDVEVFEYNSLTPMQKTITSNSTAKYLVCTFWTNSDTLTEQQIRDSIQIEPGNKANRYTPYGVAPIELCKINTCQDKLFKAISGDTVYDTLTTEQKAGLVSGGWYKYGDFNKAILNGNITCSFQNAPSQAIAESLNTAYFSIPLVGGANGKNLKSNFLGTPYNSAPAIWGNAQSTSGTLPQGMYFDSNNLRIRILKSTLTGWNDTLTREQKQNLLKSWLSNNNMILYYELTTPTITQITDTTLIAQLENLYSAMSKNGQTNVLQTNADVPFTIYASALKGG